MAKDAVTIAKKEMKRRHFASAIQMLEARSEIYEENFEYYLTLGIACLYAGNPKRLQVSARVHASL